MRRSSRCAIASALFLTAGCGTPVTPTNKPPAPRSTKAPELDAASAKACGEAARIGYEAAKLAKEGRFLRAATLLDQTEALCPRRDPALIELHAQALAEIGRCAGVRRLAAATTGKPFQKADATCAERTRGAGDVAAENKSRSLAREGQRSLRRGDLARSEQLAVQALAAAATDEALLLAARVHSQKGDAKRARLAFDRAFVALERAGEPNVLVIPSPLMSGADAAGSQVVVAGKQLWILRGDIPDRAVRTPWADATSHGGVPNTQGVAAAASGRFVIVGGKTVALLDTESARILDSIEFENPALRVLEGRRRAVIFARGSHAYAGSTKLVDLTDPARLRLIGTYEGAAIDDTFDGSAVLINSFAGVSVIDAATGKEEIQFEQATSGAFSSDGKLVALCQYGPVPEGAINDLVLFDREKNRERWRRKNDCAPSSPLYFGYKDLTIHGPKNVLVKDGREVEEYPESPIQEREKPPPPNWLMAGFNEKLIGCTRSLSGDGALFSGGCSGDAGVYETRTGKRLFKSDKRITLPPRGPVVATEDALCDVRTAACLSLAPYCNKGNVVFSPDAARVLCASDDGLRELAWDRLLIVRTNRVFPGSEGWLPLSLGPRIAGALHVSAASTELFILDLEKGSTIEDGRSVGVLLSPDASFLVHQTGAEPAVFDPLTGKRSALPGHAGFVMAAVVSPDGKVVGLRDAQQTWRFWALPEARLLSRFDGLDRPRAKPDEPMLLSGTQGLTAQILSTGYIAGELGSRDAWQLNLTQGFWLAPIADPTKLLGARFTGTGGYLMETTLGSRALGKARVALLGDGTSILACGFGDALVAPLDVCREAFVFNDLAAAAFGSVPPP